MPPSPPPLAAGAELDWAAVELDYAVSPLAADRIPAVPPAPPRFDDTPDWDAIEREYAANEVTVDGICAVHGITRWQLYHRARNYGWPLRRSSSLAARHRIQTEFAHRLMTALDLKMTQFENRIAEAGSAADSERDARTLNTLVRLFEKLKGLSAPAAKTGVRVATLVRRAPTAAASTERRDYEADKLRNELAQRLERLRGQIGG